MTWRPHALGKTCLTEPQVATARQLRETAPDAYTYAKLGALFDVAKETVKRALEPEYAAICRERVNRHRQHRSVEYVSSHGHMTPTQYRQAIRRLPPDTRDNTGQIMGDPLTGRSALDQRKGAT